MWELLNVSEDTVLDLHVKDKDKMKEDTPLGTTSLILGPTLEGTREHVLELKRPDGRVHGKVFVQVRPCLYRTSLAEK